MKRFELVQWYPSLKDYFKEGDVVECNSKFVDYVKEGDNVTIPRKEVENNPDFWKKLEDFKVLSFKVLKDGQVSVKNDVISHCKHNVYTGVESMGTYTYDYLMEKDRFKIYSVERLSDNEVFTVGDEVIDTVNNRRTVDRISVYNGVDDNLKGVLQIHFTKGNWMDGYWDYLNNIEHAPVKPNKEYEILSFKKKISGKIYHKLWDGRYGYVDRTMSIRRSTLDEMLSYDMYDIHSVKRLSDGAVFTVGDDVQVTYRDDRGRIDEIQINEYHRGGLVVVLDGIRFSILNIKHADKQSLFTTEDGVGIYEGDDYWIIDVKYKNGTVVQKTTAVDAPLVDHFKRFSTKEKAEEWIDNNSKNTYTEDEIKYALEGSTIGYTTNSNLIISKVTFETLLNLK